MSGGEEDEHTSGRCAHCGEVYGVYEPVIMLVPGEPKRRTSVLADRAGGPQVTGDVRVMHERCFARARS